MGFRGAREVFGFSYSGGGGGGVGWPLHQGLRLPQPQMLGLSVTRSPTSEEDEPRRHRLLRVLADSANACADMGCVVREP